MIRGISLEGKKDSTLITWTLKRLRNPVRVRIPLRQGSRDRASACVRHDDTVQAGQVIARPADDFSTPLHASVSGRVITVGSFAHPYLDHGDAIEIIGDGKNETAPGVGTERAGWESLERPELAAIFRESGLVTMDEAMVPLHVLLEEAPEGRIQTLVVNACEPEPYVTSEHALLMSHPLEVLKGAEILRKALGAQKVIVALLDDKLQVAELLKSKIYFLKWNHIEIRVLPRVYPQGLDLPLAGTLFSRKLHLPSGFHAESSCQDRGLSLARLFHAEGFHMQNAAAVYAVYEAVVLQKPLYERAVTVGGECVMEPKNLWLPLGLSLQDAFKNGKGIMRQPGRVTVGGPMQGRSQETLETPLVKGIPAVLALPPEVASSPQTSACVHCGKCLEVCPEGLSPAMITLAAENALYEEASAWNVQDCIRCGSCTYICPSKRPLASLLDEALRHLPR